MIISLSLTILIVVVAVLILGRQRSESGPRIHFADLWRWDGAIDRGTYLAAGLIGFGLKHNIDRVVATYFFHRPWSLFNYWIPPARAIRITSLPKEEANFLATMLLMALPFVFAGVVLTLRRLRDAGLPLWLVAFFFAPVVNLAFFAVLSALPSRDERAADAAAEPPQTMLARVIPDSALGSAAMAVFVTLIVGTAATLLAIQVFRQYGWGLFVALPFCLGLAAVLLYSYHRERSLLSCLAVAAIATGLLALVLLALAIEGAICLVMAAPIALALALLGGWVGYLIQRRPAGRREAPSVLLALMTALPLLMGAEWISPAGEPRFEVRTAIEINAAPEEVWRRLVSFPAVAEPPDRLFRLGIAYPIQSSIDDQRIGGLRQCLFSTGTFVESIDACEEPRQLGFSVTAFAPPMRELSPYGAIHTPHLDGYFQPQHARFELVPLPGGRTRLEGVSQYHMQIWPAEYWRLWSDWIIHQVHLRVFRHIKQLAEQRG